mgnify:CR=1 FL=1
MKRKLKGFTLVELVITIAIVIILSVVSVPIYRGYTDKAKMSEAYALLGVILSAQKAYYSEYGNFLDDYQSSFKGLHFSCNESVLGIDARGNKYFTSFWFDWSGVVGSSTQGKYHFTAFVALPEDFNAQKYIRLLYNVTSGATFGYSNYVNATDNNTTN